MENVITLTEEQYNDLLMGNTRRRNLNVFQQVMKEFEPDIEELAKIKHINKNVITESIRSSARAAFGVRIVARIPCDKSNELRRVISGTLSVIREMTVQHSQC